MPQSIRITENAILVFKFNDPNKINPLACSSTYTKWQFRNGVIFKTDFRIGHRGKLNFKRKYTHAYAAK